MKQPGAAFVIKWAVLGRRRISAWRLRQGFDYQMSLMNRIDLATEISSDNELPRNPKRGLEMMRLMKSLLYYPMRVLVGLFILIGEILGGFLDFGLVLIGVLKLAGELDVV